MPDFNIRSDSVNVEEIMQQIRARIREKRGVDYTEQEIRELAAVKLEKFLDPSNVRSDLLEQYRQLQRDQANPDAEVDDQALFGSPRPWVRLVRRLLRPILKLFLNPIPLMRAARLDTVRHAELFYELMHNLVIETTRLGIEVKNLKMRVESLSSRLDFDERRARALEGTVQYRATAAPDAGPRPPGREQEEGAATESAVSRSRRRRRRRGRRGGQRAGGEDAAAAGVDRDATTPDDHMEADAAGPRGDGEAQGAERRYRHDEPDAPDAPEGEPGDGEPGA